MDLVYSTIPQISISPAPPQDPVLEPFSPFSTLSFSAAEGEGFRSQHLTPPPTHTTFHRQLSPLVPTSSAKALGGGKGLEPERFEALLKASRERTGAKKQLDLRKEIALKAHKTKQVERRALFLSKVFAPPSPTATGTPKTPPDSPAILHYTLPSPGLVSPLALFESLNNQQFGSQVSYSCHPWVEQVDFRLPEEHIKLKLPPSILPRRSQPLPSLEQISARMSSQAGNRISHGNPPHTTASSAPANRPRLSIGVGRLKMPFRPPPSDKPLSQQRDFLPISPLAPQPELEITTLVVPRTTVVSSTALSKTNLQALESRERRAHNMLSTIRRRTVSSSQGITGHDMDDIEGRKARLKRHSAPAELMAVGSRMGFEHPALTMPGGF